MFEQEKDTEVIGQMDCRIQQLENTGNHRASSASTVEFLVDGNYEPLVYERYEYLVDEHLDAISEKLTEKDYQLMVDIGIPIGRL